MACTNTPTQLPSYLTADLPAVVGSSCAGRLARLLDRSRSVIIDTGTAWRSVEHGIFDVRAFGAIGDGVADDAPAINAAVVACVAAGGGTVYSPPGIYRLTVPIVLNMGSGAVSLQFLGAGKTATLFKQVTAGQDVIQAGITGAEVADYLYLADFSTYGGRYGLNLNNVLVSTFERITLAAHTVGIYGQGQNESLRFRDIEVLACTTHGISFGNTNGAVVPVLDLPELQKSLFEGIRVAFTGGGVAIEIKAGVLGAQQVSSHNTFRRLLFESNQQGCMTLNYCQDTEIVGLTTEDTANANNTYIGFTVSNSSVWVRQFQMFDSRNANKYAYTVGVNGSTLVMSDGYVETATVGAMQVTGDIKLTRINLAAIADIKYSATTYRQRAYLLNVMDTAGEPLAGQIQPGDGGTSGPSMELNGLIIDGGNVTRTIYNGPRNLRLAVSDGAAGDNGLLITTTTGALKADAYGAGTATFDASGNITSVSDERLKTGFRRFSRGLLAVLRLRPILHKWTEASGYETAHEYVGFGAGAVQRAIPETVGMDPRGFLSLSDRGILAALVNSVQKLFWFSLALWGVTIAYLVTR